MLAKEADGCTDALLTAHGFKLDVLISIASAELATVTSERTLAAGAPVESRRCGLRTRGGGRQRRINNHGRRNKSAAIKPARVHNGLRKRMRRDALAATSAQYIAPATHRCGAAALAQEPTNMARSL